MKTAIILHGMPFKEEYERDGTAANNWWLPWLRDKLIERGIKAVNPEMPEPYAPDYEKWRSVFEQYPVDENTILVGHSAGGGFLVRWLSENKIKVGEVVLVAPWIDPTNTFSPAMFGGLTIDPLLVERTKGVTELISLDDEQDELDTLRILKEKLPGLQVIEFKDKGHFLSKEIPEVLEILDHSS